MTNGNFSVSGTIGQPDASANNALSGGSFSLTGGFWSLLRGAGDGLPTLFIRLVSPNSAVVSVAEHGQLYRCRRPTTISPRPTGLATAGYTV